MASTRKSTIPDLKAKDKTPEPAKASTPEASEVLPGGGVAVGATLNVLVPVPPSGNATPEANTPKATDEELAVLGVLGEGNTYTFEQVTSVPLAEGGYVSVSKVKVVASEPGKVVVEVVS